MPAKKQPARKPSAKSPAKKPARQTKENPPVPERYVVPFYCDRGHQFEQEAVPGHVPDAAECPVCVIKLNDNSEVGKPVPGVEGQWR